MSHAVKSRAGRGFVALSIMFITIMVVTTIFAKTAQASVSENEYWTPSHGNYTAGNCCLVLRVRNAAVFTEDINAWNAGASAWNGSPANIIFDVTSSGYDYTLWDYSNCADARDGHTMYTYSGGWFTSMNGYLNDCYLRSYTSPKAQSVAVHEMGHQISLDHLGPLPCANDPIMDPNTDSRYDTCGHSTPQWDDINGVNAHY